MAEAAQACANRLPSASAADLRSGQDPRGRAPQRLIGPLAGENVIENLRNARSDEGVAGASSGFKRRGGFAGDGALAGGSAIVANAATYVFYAAATRVLGVEDGGALLAVLAAALMCSVPVGVIGLGLSGVVSHMRALGDDAGVSSLLRRLTRLYLAGAVGLIVFGASARAPSVRSSTSTVRMSR